MVMYCDDYGGDNGGQDCPGYEAPATECDRCLQIDIDWRRNEDIRYAMKYQQERVQRYRRDAVVMIAGEGFIPPAEGHHWASVPCSECGWLRRNQDMHRFSGRSLCPRCWGQWVGAGRRWLMKVDRQEIYRREKEREDIRWLRQGQRTLKTLRSLLRSPEALRSRQEAYIQGQTSPI